MNTREQLGDALERIGKAEDDLLRLGGWTPADKGRWADGWGSEGYGVGRKHSRASAVAIERDRITARRTAELLRALVTACDGSEAARGVTAVARVLAEAEAHLDLIDQ